MKDPSTILNEEATLKAFDKQSAHFDVLFGEDTIIRYKRERVRDHVLQFLEPGSSILELNAGTGEDAIYFAGKGYKVHATDISTGMQEMMEKKLKFQDLKNKVSHEICSYTELGKLGNKGPFDLIFSNFAGLNCTSELAKVLDSFSTLLKPTGRVTLVIMPKFCLWEFLLLFKGKFRTAFRRFSGKNGTRANIDGQEFRCWYYNPSFIKRTLRKEFEVISVEGLCSLVPPSYMENFAEKHSSLYNGLVRKEGKLKSKWPWRNIGDYYIITLAKGGEK